jgi:hypothetical protein
MHDKALVEIVHHNPTLPHMNDWNEEVLPNLEMFCWQLATQTISKCFVMKPKYLNNVIWQP